MCVERAKVCHKLDSSETQNLKNQHTNAGQGLSERTRAHQFKHFCCTDGNLTIINDGTTILKRMGVQHLLAKLYVELLALQEN